METVWGLSTQNYNTKYFVQFLVLVGYLCISLQGQAMDLV